MFQESRNNSSGKMYLQLSTEPPLGWGERSAKYQKRKTGVDAYSQGTAKFKKAPGRVKGSIENKHFSMKMNTVATVAKQFVKAVGVNNAKLFTTPVCFSGRVCIQRYLLGVKGYS